jgi:hypothetical protein
VLVFSAVFSLLLMPKAGVFADSEYGGRVTVSFASFVR